MGFDLLLSRRAALDAALFGGFSAFSALGPARAQSSEAAAGDPVATVKSLQDGLLDVLLKAASLTPKQRFDALQPAIAAAFDLSGMAKIGFGAGWEALPEAQKAEAARALGDYIAASYAARFEDLRIKGFERDAQIVQRGDAPVVTTRMILVAGAPMPIDYVMRQTPKGWLVADILANGSISELAGWRGTIRGLAAQGGAQAVMDGLKQRTEAFLTP